MMKYADQAMLTEDIRKVDKIYLCFVKLKEENIRTKGLILPEQVLNGCEKNSGVGYNREVSASDGCLMRP